MATNMTTNLSAISAPQNRIEKNRIDNNIIDKNISDQNIAPDAGESADNWDGTGMETPMTNTYPTCSEIDIYCDEQGLRNVSAAQFWTHYYLKGWKDKDGQPVKDWKALLKRWNDSG